MKIRNIPIITAGIVLGAFLAAQVTILFANADPIPPINNGGAVYQKVCINDWTGEERWRLNQTVGCEEALNDPSTGRDKVTGIGHWFTDWIVRRDGMGCGEGRHPEVRTDDGRIEESCLN